MVLVEHQIIIGEVNYLYMHQLQLNIHEVLTKMFLSLPNVVLLPYPRVKQSFKA